MRLLEQPGGHVFVAEAPVWDSKCPTLQGRDHLLIGVTPQTVKAHATRGLSHYIGQLYGVVNPGLIHAQYLFQGLKRGMMVGVDGDAATKKQVATWKQDRDAVLVGSARDCELKYFPAPPARVYAVIISPNEMVEQYPAIHGWAEHWTWVAADPKTVGAPVDWETRYDKRLWAA